MSNQRDTESNIFDSTPANTSSPRYFYIGMALFLILMVVLGFGSTYGHQLVTGKEISGAGVVETDWVIHIHAAVFVGWMAFLLAQTTFVYRDQTLRHMTAGKTVGIGLAISVLMAGSLITYDQIQALISKGIYAKEEWLNIFLVTMQSWMGLLLFAGLFGLGWIYRKQPEVHKRYMMFATIMLVFAATSRMGYLLGSWHNTIGMGLMVAPVYIYDLYTRGRVHTTTLVGTVGAVISVIIQYLWG